MQRHLWQLALRSCREAHVSRGFLGDRMGLPPAWTDKGAAVRDD